MTRFTDFGDAWIRHRMAAFKLLFWYTALGGLCVAYNLIGLSVSTAVADPLPADYSNPHIIDQSFVVARVFIMSSIAAFFGYGLLAVVGCMPDPYEIARGLNLAHLQRHTKWTDVCAALPVSLCTYLLLIFYLCATVLDPLVFSKYADWWLTAEARFVAFLCALPFGLLTLLAPAWWRAHKCKKVSLYHLART